MKLIALVSCLVLAAACGDDNAGDAADGGTDTTDSDSGDADGTDATGDGGLPPDGPPITPTSCTAPIPGNPQCSNCIDDDGDGTVDTYDLHCSGPLDDDEASFATGISGDNVDAVMQDCFFDGNSGAGNDGCNIHVCCLLGAATVAECPLGANQYDPADCPPPLGTEPLSQQCTETCGALTPPGCDCFGCCTLCNPDDPTECYDILTNPNISPNCTSDTLADPSVCMRCEQVESCGPSACGGDTCILCPGQTPDDLPDSCTGSACPVNTPSCAGGEACPANTYCASSGCCVGVVQ